MKRRSLERLQDDIAATIVQRNRYWHSFVEFQLGLIAKYYGDDSVRMTILKLGLDKMGWKVKN